jgi:Transmembrane protein 43
VDISFCGVHIDGISMLFILRPLATIVDIVPFVGDCMQSSMKKYRLPLVAVIVALTTCLFFIALVWLAYRPSIVIPIMLVSLFFIALFYWKIHSKNQEKNYGSDGPTKPKNYESDTATDTFSSLNRPGHSNIAPHDEGMNDGGFEIVLDHAQTPTMTIIYENDIPSVTHTDSNITSGE